MSRFVPHWVLPVAAMQMLALGHAAGQRSAAFVAKPDLVLDDAADRLSGVTWMGIRHDGSVVVAPDMNQDARFYSLAGKRLLFAPSPRDRSLIARGFVGDSVWGYDPSRSTLTLVGPNLERVRTIPFPSSLYLPSGDVVGLLTIGNPFRPLAVEPDGSLLVSAVSRAPPESWQRPPHGSNVVLRIAASGQLRAVVGWPEAPGDECYHAGLAFPFCLPPMLSIMSHGEAFVSARAFTAGADSGFILVSMIRATGDTAYSRRYPFVALRVSQHDADSAIQRMKSMPRARISGIDSLIRPTIYPPLMFLSAVDDGTVWIQQPTAGDTATWLVLDAAGNVSRTVRVPKGIRIWAVAGDVAWGTRANSDSSQTVSIVRLRITPAP
jgi:hypothetical protein